MLAEAIGGMLPAIMAIALTPLQLVEVVLVLGGRHGRAGGPAFVIGWLAALTAVTVVAILIVEKLGERDRTGTPLVHWLQLALGVLLLGTAIRLWQTRPHDGAQVGHSKMARLYRRDRAIAGVCRGRLDGIGQSENSRSGIGCDGFAGLFDAVFTTGCRRCNPLCDPRIVANHHSCNSPCNRRPGDACAHRTPQGLFAAQQQPDLDGRFRNARHERSRKWRFWPPLKRADTPRSCCRSGTGFWPASRRTVASPSASGQIAASVSHEGGQVFARIFSRVDYEDNGLVFDAVQHGPIRGAVLRF